MYRKRYIYLVILLFMFLFFAIMRSEKEVITDYQVGVQQGDRAYPFRLINNHGKNVTLNDFAGKKVILNFFATWCGPCQEEMPLIVELHKKVSDEKLVIIGVNVTKEEPNPNIVKQFIRQYEMSFDVLFDEEGKMMEQYQLIGIPTTILIDEDGKIVQRINGMIFKEMIETHPFFQNVFK